MVYLFTENAKVILLKLISFPEQGVEGLAHTTVVRGQGWHSKSGNLRQENYISWITKIRAFFHKWLIETGDLGLGTLHQIRVRIRYFPLDWKVEDLQLLFAPFTYRIVPRRVYEGKDAWGGLLFLFLFQFDDKLPAAASTLGREGRVHSWILSIEKNKGKIPALVWLPEQTCIVHVFRYPLQ